VAYTRTYRTIVPVEHGISEDVTVWLARETFEKRAAADMLQIVDFQWRIVDPDDIPPKVEKQLGRPVTDFTWYEFTGEAKRATSV